MLWLDREIKNFVVPPACGPQVLTLSRDQFTALLGNLSQLRSVWRLEALRKVPLLATLPPAALDRLADKLEQVYLKSNTEVIKQVSTVHPSTIAQRVICCVGHAAMLDLGYPNALAFETCFVPHTPVSRSKETRASSVRAISCLGRGHSIAVIQNILRLEMRMQTAVHPCLYYTDLLRAGRGR